MPTAEEIGRAAAALTRGEVVAYPTETFYGLAVDALEEEALEKLRLLKGRGEKAISVLVSGLEMVERLCLAVPPLARQMMAAHWPGALTIALPARPGLPAALVSEGCVAVRESPEPTARALVAAFGGPITATSANPAGAAPPTTAAAVHQYFGYRCLILDSGETAGGLASTLIRVKN